jgi:hypothetical protein
MKNRNVDPSFTIQQNDEKLLKSVTSPDTLLSLKEESLAKACPYLIMLLTKFFK